jgi:hypothetical protein
VEVPYFLSKYDPDPLRFYLTATAPETSDTPTAVLVGGLPRAEQQRMGNPVLGMWEPGQKPRLPI